MDWDGSKDVSLDEWLDSWTPELMDEGIAIAVFQTPEGFGVPVSPDRLAEDLEAELAKMV